MQKQPIERLLKPLKEVMFSREDMASFSILECDPLGRTLYLSHYPATAFSLICLITERIPCQTVRSVKISTTLP